MMHKEQLQSVEIYLCNVDDIISYTYNTNVDWLKTSMEEKTIGCKLQSEYGSSLPASILGVVRNVVFTTSSVELEGRQNIKRYVKVRENI